MIAFFLSVWLSIGVGAAAFFVLVIWTDGRMNPSRGDK